VTVFAYLRVSTDRQDVDNQRHGIFEYANAQQLGPLTLQRPILIVDEALHL
jgi:DNA invertase Pin-like site-specific DNA recombinase